MEGWSPLGSPVSHSLITTLASWKVYIRSVCGCVSEVLANELGVVCVCKEEGGKGGAEGNTTLKFRVLRLG